MMKGKGERGKGERREGRGERGEGRGRGERGEERNIPLKASLNKRPPHEVSEVGICKEVKDKQNKRKEKKRKEKERMYLKMVLMVIVRGCDGARGERVRR